MRSDPPIALRAATIADLSALLALEAQFPGDRLSRRQMRHHLRAGDGRLRVAVDAGGKVLGAALVLCRRGSTDVRLYSLVVDGAARGRGIGRRLLADIEAYARSRGRHALRLEVREDNVAAQALYRAAGFADSGRRQRYYDDGADAICMRRVLAASDA